MNAKEIADLINKGIDKGLVEFIVDPNFGVGTVCQIGGNWFYFGGETAEEESPAEYLAHVPKEDIVREIMDALDGLWEVERDYYVYFLMENLG